jgi:hypothetical protein
VTTVLAVYSSDGCVGRCDARCHDAIPGSDCDCICRGANHGRGTARAVENTRADLQRLTAPERIAAFERRHGVGAVRVEAMPDVTQLDLSLGGQDADV